MEKKYHNVKKKESVWNRGIIMEENNYYGKNNYVKNHYERNHYVKKTTRENESP